MRSYRLVLVSLLAGALSVFLIRPAQAEQLIDVHLTDKVIPGASPSLTVSTLADVKTLTLELKRADGKRFNFKKSNIARGSKRTFELTQKSGRLRYRGTLKVELHSGQSGSMNLDFVAVIMPSMGLEVRYNDLDLTKHTLKLRAKRPIGQVDYQIVSDAGAELGHGSFKVPRPASSVQVPWEQKPGKVLKIVLTAHDQDGFTGELSLFPWSWSIPHEELVFQTGKWDIQASEAPKLDQSYTLLQEGLAKYGKLLPIKLYIAGHTDTVADAQSNLRLSEKRALSIARHFRKMGFKHPIYYRGYGEGALKVETPDNTDEVQNRRAEYLLAAQPPRVATSTASGRWKKL